MVKFFLNRKRAEEKLCAFLNFSLSIGGTGMKRPTNWRIPDTNGFLSFFLLLPLASNSFSVCIMNATVNHQLKWRYRHGMKELNNHHRENKCKYPTFQEYIHDWLAIFEFIRLNLNLCKCKSKHLFSIQSRAYAIDVKSAINRF